MLSEDDMISMSVDASPVPLRRARMVTLVWYPLPDGWQAMFCAPDTIILSAIAPAVRDPRAIEDARLRAVPALAHELCHHEQYHRMGALLWWLCRVPVVRQLTIEREAYRVEDAVRAAIFGV